MDQLIINIICKGAKGDWDFWISDRCGTIVAYHLVDSGSLPSRVSFPSLGFLRVFSSTVRQSQENLGPNHPRISLAIIIIIHYGCQWPEMLTPPETQIINNLVLWSGEKPWWNCYLTPVVNFGEVWRAQLDKPLSSLSRWGPWDLSRSFKVCSDAKERVGCRKQWGATASIHPW